MRGPSENVIAMPQSQLFALVVLLFLQTATDLSFTEGTLNPKEKEQLARAINVEQRIKVYITASSRIQQTLHGLAADGDFAKIPDSLQVWNTLLSGSLRDIEANLKTKKKSRALIRYEIQVRKLLTEVQEYKNNIPEEDAETFKSLLAQADKIRKQFVEIIFRQ
jgi:hypothetical protein